MSMRTDLKVRLEEDKPLAGYTTMQVGGNARYFAEPKTEQELFELIEFARHEQAPFFLLGKGSNTLFPDNGYAGLVILMTSFKQDAIKIDQENKILTASSGTHLSRLVIEARDAGLGGAEFLCNVPGTLGGALVMNAGFSRDPNQKNEICDIVKSVKVVGAQGEVETIERCDLEYGYRSSSLRGKIVVEGTLQLKARTKAEISHEIRANFDFRNSKQDLRYPSSGSIFRNPPPPAPAAAKLVDDVGFRGRKVGNAMISSKHCNYIVNLGGAKTAEIIQLIEETKKAVIDASGIELQTEVCIVENR